MKVETLTLFLHLSSVFCDIVKIENGKIKGSKIKYKTGKPLYTFYRIPYAKPPLGVLRFQPPEPVDSWKGVLDATKPGPVCYQTKKHRPRSEDCLHLNIYTSSLKAFNPVVVMIHGGGFLTGGYSKKGEIIKSIRCCSILEIFHIFSSINLY
jgi:carboxylesterase type B